VDVSIQEAVAATLEHVMVRYFADRVVSGRQGPLHWNHAFHIFPCKDGFIHMTLFQQWETLVAWMDQEGMAEDLTDEKYGDEEFRLDRLDHILGVIERWTRTHRKDELFELGQLMRFPWSPVYSPAEVVKSPQLEARKFMRETEKSGKGPRPKTARLPWLLSPPVRDPRKHAPKLGEHNARIYGQELGMSKGELERLRKAGII
jgi:crotonobetainyl-CoA:carnitine CoA-transferase CaiB-like acyl-CoA transferase